MRSIQHRPRYSIFPQFALRHIFYLVTALCVCCAYIVWRTQSIGEEVRWRVVESLGVLLAIYLTVVGLNLGLYALRTRSAGTLIALGSMHAREWVPVHFLNIVFSLGFGAIAIVELSVAPAHSSLHDFLPFSLLIILLPVLLGVRSVTYFAQHHARISARGLMAKELLPWCHFRRHYWREREQLELHLLPTIGWQIKVFIDPSDRAAVQKVLDDAGLAGAKVFQEPA